MDNPTVATRRLCRPQDKPNILVIWGDDIGWYNISAYNHGLMGYKTPNIDRIAKEGALFTDCLRPAELYGRPRRVHHRTERRSAPASPRSGLPAPDLGMPIEDPTIAEPCSRITAT